jgi:hypothetical protein
VLFLTFGVDKKTAPGKIAQQIVRNVQLQQHISQTLAARESVVDEIILPGESGDKFLQINDGVFLVSFSSMLVGTVKP